MSGTRWLRVRELFEAVVDNPPADLDRWLAEHCDDAEVRQEVVSLLAHHSQAGAFLSEPVGDLSSLLLAAPEDADDAGAGLAPGLRVGPYEIVAEAGRGGMGRIYRALDTRLNRTVALKALPAGVAPDVTQRERLRREARAAAALSHPGICTVHALEEIDGGLYMVSEFIDGRTLREDIAQGPRPALPLLLDTARQLAEALAAAHGAGVVHRDLKPENVMRTAEGRLKVLDFGLARIDQASPAGASPLVTQPGAVVGTPAYMAPEQLNGQTVDARADVFAFGVLVYEYATGRHPFEAETLLGRAARVLEATPEPFAVQRPDVPADFAAAIDRCLMKAPSARFETGAALAAELARSVAGPARSTGAPAARPRPLTAIDAAARDTSWWRTHQVTVVALYFTSSAAAWLAKEWRPGAASGLFIAVGIAATVGGVLRAHLVFTERTHGRGLDAERRRVEPITWATDLGIAAALAADGLALTPTRAVAGVLILGLAVGLALARIILEPSTTRAAFD